MYERMVAATISMIVDRLHFSGAWIEILWRYACLVASFDVTVWRSEM